MFKVLVVIGMMIFSTQVKGNAIDEVIALLKDNKIGALVQYFDQRVEIKLYNKAEQYPKAQAAIIVKDFFSGKSISNVAIAGKNDKGIYQYCRLEMLVSNTKYKVNFTTNASGNSFVITSLNIETG